MLPFGPFKAFFIIDSNVTCFVGNCLDRSTQHTLPYETDIKPFCRNGQDRSLRVWTIVSMTTVKKHRALYVNNGETLL